MESNDAQPNNNIAELELDFNVPIPERKQILVNQPSENEPLIGVVSYNILSSELSMYNV